MSFPVFLRSLSITICLCPYLPCRRYLIFSDAIYAKSINHRSVHNAEHVDVSSLIHYWFFRLLLVLINSRPTSIYNCHLDEISKVHLVWRICNGLFSIIWFRSRSLTNQFNGSSGEVHRDAHWRNLCIYCAFPVGISWIQMVLHISAEMCDLIGVSCHLTAFSIFRFASLSN